MITLSQIHGKMREQLMMERNELKIKLEQLLVQMEKMGAECEPLIFEPPATENEVAEVERELGFKLPIEFRNVLLTISKECRFRWELPDSVVILYQPMRELTEPVHRHMHSGELHWGIDLLLRYQKDIKDEWIKEVYFDPTDNYSKAWHNKLAFLTVDDNDSDYFAIDLSAENYGKIIYLCHDGDVYSNGCVIANSFNEFLENGLQIAFSGGDSWEWDMFTHNRTSGIDPNCENAKIWREKIGLGSPTKKTKGAKQT